jgi:geranylgeranyl reductase family protein
MSETRPDASRIHDVIVVGGGPSGAATAWALARQGVDVAVIERSRFPRDKVCGDFIEPGGLRILRAMDVIDGVAAGTAMPITGSQVFIGFHRAYRGDIPYYQDHDGLPPHGAVLPRSVLDARLLDRAQVASARVIEGCSVEGARRDGGLMHVDVRSGSGDVTLRARLVVGADGAESRVARGQGLWRNDRRHIAISQRGYVDGVAAPAAAGDGGEATLWFDEDLFPGYGWMFPMPGGRANVGVGILSEACHRHDLPIRQAFTDFLEKLSLRHPGCADAPLSGPAIGGIVKTYGGAGPNHFDGGVLVGDAGAFADPMTGEGVTQGMESGLIAALTLKEALEDGRFDAPYLSRYEADFRSYFDPSMAWLDLSAALMRNWHLRAFWLRAGLHGFARASENRAFARVAGSTFGGPAVQPLSILGQMAASLARHLIEGGAGAIADLVSGRLGQSSALAADWDAWEKGWRASMARDPAWHYAWLTDVARRAARLSPSLLSAENPRLAGPPL